MATPVESLLTALHLRGCEPTKIPSGEWSAKCPAHEDENPSLSVGEANDGRALVYCHAGCAQDAVIAALGMELRDLFPPPNGNGRKPVGKTVAAYPYVDEHGTLLFEVVRFAEPKDFRQRRPDGHGGWDWKLKGVRRVLYRLPEVITAVAAGAPLFVVEGEKDANNLTALGLAATTNPGGAGKGKWRAEFSEALVGARVFVIPDNDDSGREHAQAVARALHGKAASVKIVTLPDVPEKGDVSDWLDAGHDAGDLLRLAGAAPDWTPMTGSSEEEAGTAAAPDDPSGQGGVRRLYASDPVTLTDTGNAARLVELHGSRLRFAHAWGRWLVWDGGRWHRDPGGALTSELAKDVGAKLRREAAEIADSSLASDTFKHGQKSLSSAGITSMVRLARGMPGIIIEHEQLDADGWLLGVANGVVDLRRGSFRAADPTDLMTMQCPVAWDEVATAPRWERAMEEWFPDPELRSYVHRLAGAALVGLQRDHVFVIHYGSGANGKGTFVRALQRVLGPYAVEIHLSLLVETAHQQHDTVKADLFRTRLAVATETERRVRLAEASVKNLTGGDRIRARRMREDPWSFDPTHSLWLQTNHLPEITGRDEGIWRRIRVVKWASTFAGKQADQRLDETLAVEGPGILRWLVTGCLDWQRHGLKEPEAVIRETLAYRQREDAYNRFAADAGLTFDPKLGIEAGTLQERLTEWATSEGLDVARLRQGIGDWLREHGCTQAYRRFGGSRRKYWNGVGVPGVGGPVGPVQHPDTRRRTRGWSPRLPSLPYERAHDFP